MAGGDSQSFIRSALATSCTSSTKGAQISWSSYTKQLLLRLSTLCAMMAKSHLSKLNQLTPLLWWSVLVMPSLPKFEPGSSLSIPYI
ncbi:hypothetical protein LINPERHAP1_LOCUS14899 [Linum perenne]